MPLFSFCVYYLQLCLNHLNKRILNGSNWCYSPSAKALEAFVGDQLYWTWQVRSSISVGVFGARIFSCINGESLMRRIAMQKVLLGTCFPSIVVQRKWMSSTEPPTRRRSEPKSSPYNSLLRRCQTVVRTQRWNHSSDHLLPPLPPRITQLW